MMESVIEGRVAIVLSHRDNVAIALKDLKSGDAVNVSIGDAKLIVKLLNDIPLVISLPLGIFVSAIL